MTSNYKWAHSNLWPKAMYITIVWMEFEIALSIRSQPNLIRLNKSLSAFQLMQWIVWISLWLIAPEHAPVFLVNTRLAQPTNSTAIVFSHVNLSGEKKKQPNIPYLPPYLNICSWYKRDLGIEDIYLALFLLDICLYIHLFCIFSWRRKELYESTVFWRFSNGSRAGFMS